MLVWNVSSGTNTVSKSIVPPILSWKAETSKIKTWSTFSRGQVNLILFLSVNQWQYVLWSILQSEVAIQSALRKKWSFEMVLCLNGQINHSRITAPPTFLLVGGDDHYIKWYKNIYTWGVVRCHVWLHEGSLWHSTSCGRGFNCFVIGRRGVLKKGGNTSWVCLRKLVPPSPKQKITIKTLTIATDVLCFWAFLLSSSSASSSSSSSFGGFLMGVPSKIIHLQRDHTSTSYWGTRILRNLQWP